jgi:glycosyltransferase involved in cell wall biosynthesis
MYRAESTILLTIEHLCRQTLLPSEVIFVDDGSPDKSASVVESFISQGPPFEARLIRQKNAGPAKARNTGIHASCQPLIAFLDQDDLWAESKLKRCFETLQGLGPEYVGIYHRYHLLFPDGHKEIGKFFTADSDCYEQLIRTRNFIANSTVVARKVLIDKVGFFDESPNLIGAEDYDLWLRLAAIGKWHGIDEDLMCYTAGVGYSWSSFQRQQIHAFNALMKHLRQGYRPLSLRLATLLIFHAAQYRYNAISFQLKNSIKNRIKHFAEGPSF